MVCSLLTVDLTVDFFGLNCCQPPRGRLRTLLDRREVSGTAGGCAGYSQVQEKRIWRMYKLGVDIVTIRWQQKRGDKHRLKRIFYSMWFLKLETKNSNINTNKTFISTETCPLSNCFLYSFFFSRHYYHCEFEPAFSCVHAAGDWSLSSISEPVWLICSDSVT